MAKSVLGRFNVAAKKRLKRLQAAAGQAAGGLLEMSYRDTAEQSLKGAAAVTTLLHDEMGDLKKASSVATQKRQKKAVKKKPVKKAATKAKKTASKNAAKTASNISSARPKRNGARKRPAKSR